MFAPCAPLKSIVKVEYRFSRLLTNHNLFPLLEEEERDWGVVAVCDRSTANVSTHIINSSDASAWLEASPRLGIGSDVELMETYDRRR